MADRTRSPRSQVIGAFVTDVVLTRRLTWNAYADAVVQHYHAHVALEDRIVDFRVATTAANHDQCTRLNTQTVRRLLGGEIRMCVDIEESLVAALPTADATQLMRKLLERQGLLLARQPAARGDLVGQLSAPCDLLRSAAAAVERIAPMLADGKGIGPEDAHLFGAARSALSAVQGVCATLDAQIANAMGHVPTADEPRRVAH